MNGNRVSDQPKKKTKKKPKKKPKKEINEQPPAYSNIMNSQHIPEQQPQQPQQEQHVATNRYRTPFTTERQHAFRVKQAACQLICLVCCFPCGKILSDLPPPSSMEVVESSMEVEERETMEGIENL